MPENTDMTPGLSRPDLVRVLESAARLQTVVPDAVLVGGSAAALWASHRTSFDHDHVLADLNARFDTVLEAVELSRPYGTTELLTTVIERARQDAADAEREQVAGEIRDLVARSGLSKQDFALRLGTSRPRLSAYMSGKVTPSAALMLRMRRITAQAQAGDGRQLPDHD
jgi:DNA-binding transcriptional regulator YiaG